MWLRQLPALANYGGASFRPGPHGAWHDRVTSARAWLIDACPQPPRIPLPAQDIAGIDAFFHEFDAGNSEVSMSSEDYRTLAIVTQKSEAEGAGPLQVSGLAERQLPSRLGRLG